jgi:hypothetical protein
MRRFLESHHAGSHSLQAILIAVALGYCPLAIGWSIPQPMEETNDLASAIRSLLLARDMAAWLILPPDAGIARCVFPKSYRSIHPASISSVITTAFC